MPRAEREVKIEAAAQALGVILLNNGWADDWDDSDYEGREALLIDAEAILVAAGAVEAEATTGGADT